MPCCVLTPCFSGLHITWCSSGSSASGFLDEAFINVWIRFLVQHTHMVKYESSGLCYEWGPVFACFILFTSEPTNLLLSAETSLKDPCALTIPDIQPEFHPHVEPQHHRNVSFSPEAWENFYCFEEHRASLSPTPSGDLATCLSQQECSSLSLQRMRKGLLLAQPQVWPKASAEGAQLCLSFPGPREGSRLPTSDFGSWALFFAVASSQASCHGPEVRKKRPLTAARGGPLLKKAVLVSSMVPVTWYLVGLRLQFLAFAGSFLS